MNFTLPPWLNTIFHAGAPPYVSATYPQLGDTVTLRLRSGLNAPLQNVYLRTFPDGEQALTPLHKGAADSTSQWWHIDTPILEPSVHYRFVLVADDGLWFYTAVGATVELPLDHSDFRIVADYAPPQWVQTAVFYQIFPDRFANGDPSTDPQPHEYDYKGHGPQTYAWETPPDPNQPFPLVFYGGDLPGIIDKLDYLQELGVTALYLNPIFTAYSNHKYDVADYEHVDPHFSGDAALAALRQALDARQMRYLLDIVPNHCGYWHPWFQAALADAAAPEADFFTFTNHPDVYASWLGVWSLPKLNYQSAALRQRIFAGETAVFRHWLRPPYSADGWRVDVANMLGRQGKVQQSLEIKRQIRQAVKATRPDAYLMAENFFDATPGLQGDQWDGIMNYSGFSIPLLYWLTGFHQGAHGLAHPILSDVPWPTAALAASWQSRLAAIPWAVALQQFNLLDSHDVPRIRTMLHENDALQRLALLVQFTFPGVPCIYYGDEIGMVDDAALAQRGCMIWDAARWNHDLLAYYKALIALRKESAVLQTGAFQILAVEAETIAFQRVGQNGRFLIIAHRGENARTGALPVAHGGIGDGTVFTNVFTDERCVVQNGVLPIVAQPQGATLWQA